jgi:hypothetical protein
MSSMTKKMGETSAEHPVPVDKGVGHPRKGDRFRCASCGMEIQLTRDCACKDPNSVHFHCCGQELSMA